MGKLEEDDKLLSVSIWLTAMCNLKCEYCYEGMNKPQQSISLTTLELVIRFIENMIIEKKFRLVNIIFHGGEPLLCYKDIIRVVTHFKEKSNFKDILFYYSLTTNATLLDLEKMNFLIENIYDLSISIDGIKQIHDSYRVDITGNGTFDKVVENVHYILDKREELRLRMTVCADTVEYLFQNIIFLIELGGKVIVPGINYYDKNWNELKLKELYRQLLNVSDYLYVNKLTETVKVGMINFSFEDIVKKGKCDGGNSSFSIYFNGEIYPCLEVVGHKKYQLGDLRNGIEKSKVQKLMEINKDDNGDCKGCSNIRFCENNRCKIINHLFTGDFYKVLPLKCAVENIQYHILKYNFEKYYS